MDLIFGDTAAHQEKKHIKNIEAQLRGLPVEDDEVLKPVEEQREIVDQA